MTWRIKFPCNKFYCNTRAIRNQRILHFDLFLRFRKNTKGENYIWKAQMVDFRFASWLRIDKQIEQDAAIYICVYVRYNW